MTRGLTHALCRLLALLACVMCSQPAARGVAQSWADAGAGWGGYVGAVLRADGGEIGVSVPGAPAGRGADSVPANEPSREERQSDDDQDQDDDFDGAQPLALRGTLWGSSASSPRFGAPLFHDPVCSSHRLLDPRPPRRR